jgi:hypothetical protein
LCQLNDKRFISHIIDLNEDGHWENSLWWFVQHHHSHHEGANMKAARFYDRGDIRIEDIPEPVVAPGTVGVQVAWCGICGTTPFLANPLPSPWGMSSQVWCMPLVLA